ncbi:MAG: glycosyltransferase family 4 protein [FCB group bacterium]|nr:glycosyltransferase family 4 protein [FCB group bacterium]
MIIVMLAQAGSVHNTRWSRGLAARGHRLIIISNDSLEFPATEIETIILPGSSAIAYFKNIPRVRKIIRRIKPDIVHAHYATGYGLWGSCQNTAPFVLTVWGSDIEDALKNKLTTAPIVRRALKMAQCVTSASRHLVERTLAFEPSVEDKIHVVPFGVPLPKEVDDSSKTNDDIIRFVFTKYYKPVYAPDIALKAFAVAARKNKNIRLTMIGGGPMEADLKQMAENWHLTGRVEIKGWQSMAATEKLINAADVMLMPSRRESFGVAALEALAHGKPVIGSKVGGIPEIVEDEVNGLLIPTEDPESLAMAILRLAGDRDLRRRMGRAGKAGVRERFDFEKCLDMMEELYDRIGTS